MGTPIAAPTACAQSHSTLQLFRLSVPTQHGHRAPGMVSTATTGPADAASSANESSAAPVTFAFALARVAWATTEPAAFAVAGAAFASQSVACQSQAAARAIAIPDARATR